MKTLLFLLLPFLSMAQFKLKNIEPKTIKEGQKLEFQVVFEEKLDSTTIKWGLIGNTNPSMSISSEGVFAWSPTFKTVSKNETKHDLEFFIKASTLQDSLLLSDSVLVKISVLKANRPPTIPKEPEIVWISKPNVEVSKAFLKQYYFDENGDTLVFRLLDQRFPSVKLSPDGFLTAALTSKELRNLPDTLDFEVFEQHTEERFTAIQKIILKRAEIDEAPSIRLSPDTPKFQIEEGDELSLEINISDENNDLAFFDCYTNPQMAFKIKDFIEQKNPNQYLLRWKPTLDFVKSEEPSKSFLLLIVATDEAKNTINKQIEIEITNKIDWQKEDISRELAFKQTVLDATTAYLRLENSFESAEKDIKRILKNKKLRAMASSSLSMMTKNIGLLKDSKAKTFITENANVASEGIDFSNTTAQISSMEADFPEDFKKITRFSNILNNLKNVYVDTEHFINDFNSKSNRRKPDFLQARSDFQTSISLIQKDYSLQLENLKKAVSEQEIEQVFKTFKISD
jgi:hypothetical protein